jgi:hypothetical protein
LSSDTSPALDGSLKKTVWRFRPWPEARKKRFVISGHGRKYEINWIGVSGHGRKHEKNGSSFPALAGSMEPIGLAFPAMAGSTKKTVRHFRPWPEV